MISWPNLWNGSLPLLPREIIPNLKLYCANYKFQFEFIINNFMCCFLVRLKFMHMFLCLNKCWEKNCFPGCPFVAKYILLWEIGNFVLSLPFPSLLLCTFLPFFFFGFLLSSLLFLFCLLYAPHLFNYKL